MSLKQIETLRHLSLKASFVIFHIFSESIISIIKAFLKSADKF